MPFNMRTRTTISFGIYGRHSNNQNSLNRYALRHSATYPINHKYGNFPRPTDYAKRSAHMQIPFRRHTQDLSISSHTRIKYEGAACERFPYFIFFFTYHWKVTSWHRTASIHHVITMTTMFAKSFIREEKAPPGKYSDEIMNKQLSCCKQIRSGEYSPSICRTLDVDYGPLTDTVWDWIWQTHIASSLHCCDALGNWNDVFMVATACLSPHSTQNPNCVGDIGDTFTPTNPTTPADHTSVVIATKWSSHTCQIS